MKDMDIAQSVTLLFCIYVAYHLKGLTYRMLMVHLFLYGLCNGAVSNSDYIMYSLLDM